MKARPTQTSPKHRAGLSEFIRTERDRFTLPPKKFLMFERSPMVRKASARTTHSEYVAERRVLRTPGRRYFAHPKMLSQMF